MNQHNYSSSPYYSKGPYFFMGPTPYPIFKWDRYRDPTLPSN